MSLSPRPRTVCWRSVAAPRVWSTSLTIRRTLISSKVARSVTQQTRTSLWALRRSLWRSWARTSPAALFWARTSRSAAGSVVPHLEATSRPRMTLNFLVQHSQHFITLHQHFHPYFLLRISQDAVQTFHLPELRLLTPVPSPLQLPDGLVQERNKLLHGGELGRVGIHPPGVWADSVHRLTSCQQSISVKWSMIQRVRALVCLCLVYLVAILQKFFMKP